MLTLTIADLRAREACDLDDIRIPDLVARLGRAVAEDEPITLRTSWKLDTTSITDRWWSLRAADPSAAAKIIGVRAACMAARRVLPSWEARYPDDGRPRLAIEAAEAWVADPTPARADACMVADAAVDAAADAAVEAAVFDVNASASASAYAAAHAAYAAFGSCSDSAFVYAVRAANAAVIAVADGAPAGLVGPAVAAEHEAQRADLDRLLAEVS